MALSSLLAKYGIEKYEEHITAINTRQSYFDHKRIYDLDDEKSTINKNNFIDNIREIYGYANYSSNSTQYFSLLGKLKNNRYFMYNYEYSTSFYFSDSFDIEIVISNDLSEIMKVYNEDTGNSLETFVMVKPIYKLS